MVSFPAELREFPGVDEEPHQVPITPELDLHTFRPSEIGELIPEYLAECRREGIRSVRVIHGKGTGTLREGVHALLRRMPEVESFQFPAGEGSGGWGATWVYLKARSSAVQPGENPQ
ncbi:DNA mismatch repair protein mutS [Haloferula helveola]|uniref:DNA mismatch repair protein mutS n=1 Tax=Haloferula helveola TaxID=490095 RepID=A0ABM7RHF9_9BACT|nr:DNA mismatch repair protein mutS [Haloferula helveola]